jgi:hypothetical protein
MGAGAGSGHIQTPKDTPMTPKEQQTPHNKGDEKADEDAEQAIDDLSWIIPGVHISVDGEEGKVEAVHTDGSYRIKFATSERTVTPNPRTTHAVAPQANDQVLIIAGEHKGNTGTLMSIQAYDEEPTGIVSLAGASSTSDEMFLPKISTLAKFTPP